VEAELAAGGERGLDGGEVDRVLALVVRGTAAVEPVALARQLPGIEPGAPAALLAADHVAVAIGEDSNELGILDALGDQERAVGLRIRVGLPGEAEPGEARPDLFGKVALQLGAARRVLALGGDRHAAREVGEEPALVEVPLSVGNRLVPAHRRAIISRKAAGRSTQPANRTSLE